MTSSVYHIGPLRIGHFSHILEDFFKLRNVGTIGVSLEQNSIPSVQFNSELSKIERDDNRNHFFVLFHLFLYKTTLGIHSKPSFTNLIL